MNNNATQIKKTASIYVHENVLLYNTIQHNTIQY